MSSISILLFLANQLPETPSRVFWAWIARHSGNAACNPDGLKTWLSSLDETRARREMKIIALEILWLRANAYEIEKGELLLE